MTYHRCLVDAWVAMQALRSVGIPAEELFFTLANGALGGKTAPVIAVQVKRGELVFTWTIAWRSAEMDPGELAQQWEAFATSMNEASDAEREAVWRSSTIVGAGGPGYLDLIARLNAKGFALSLPVAT